MIVADTIRLLSRELLATTTLDTRSGGDCARRGTCYGVKVKISRLARVVDLVRDLFTGTSELAYAVLRLQEGRDLVTALPDYHGTVSLRSYEHEAVQGLEARGLLDDFMSVLKDLRARRACEIGGLAQAAPPKNARALADDKT